MDKDAAELDFFPPRLISTTPTGTTIPPCSRRPTSGASPPGASRSSSVHSPSRARPRSRDN